MTKFELYDRLHKVENIDEALRIVAIKIERLETCAQGHAIRYDLDKVQTSPGDPVAKIMEDLSGLLDEQKALQRRMVDAITDVSELIGTVDDGKQRLVLHYKYIGLLHWRGIANKMHFAERHVYRLHDAGISKILKNVSKCQ